MWITLSIKAIDTVDIFKELLLLVAQLFEKNHNNIAMSQLKFKGVHCPSDDELRRARQRLRSRGESLIAST